MTLSTLEVARVEKTMSEFIEKIRPPVPIRGQLDFVYLLDKQSTEIIEVRPRWDNASEKTELPVAKIRFVKTQGSWQVYWHRANGKWQSYEPKAEVKTLSQSLAVIEKDEYGCFFG